MKKTILLLLLLPAIGYAQTKAPTTAQLNDSLKVLRATILKLQADIQEMRKILDEPFYLENARKGTLGLIWSPAPNVARIRALEAGPGIRIDYTDSTARVALDPARQ